MKERTTAASAHGVFGHTAQIAKQADALLEEWKGRFVK